MEEYLQHFGKCQHPANYNFYPYLGTVRTIMPSSDPECILSRSNQKSLPKENSSIVLTLNLADRRINFIIVIWIKNNSNTIIMTKQVDYFEEQGHFVGPLGDKGEVTVLFEVVHIDQIERRISLGQTEKKLKII